MSENIDSAKRLNRRYEAVVGLVLGCLFITFALINNKSVDSAVELPVNQQQADMKLPASPKIISSKQLDEQLRESKDSLIELLKGARNKEPMVIQIRPLDMRTLIQWIGRNEFQKAHLYLIEQASNAVDLKQDQRLGDIMQLLARVSATQGDLASAEVYLFEALAIFELLDNPRRIADTQLLIGQMYAKRRQIAQMAGWAYGDLLMARFYLSKGSHNDAKQSLDSTIQENLNLGRTGAVASAYKTMARYYRNVNDTSGEQNALIEAGKYYAHSGQAQQASKVVNQLRQRQAPLDMIESLEAEINNRLVNYESQINLVHQARDYMQLYSLYKSKGEHGRAWKFRVKASEILSRTDKRDMYFRAPDVMALLYDSNYNVARAAQYYKQAGEHYLSENQMSAYQKVEQLQSNLN